MMLGLDGTQHVTGPAEPHVRESCGN